VFLLSVSAPLIPHRCGTKVGGVEARCSHVSERLNP
jgi:hypothetical protein